MGPVAQPPTQLPTLECTVLGTYPHDCSAFCQGLHYERETKTLLESTGMYGESTCRRVDISSGRVREQEWLDRRMFGEGLSVHGDTCVQLLWREGLCLLRDAATLAFREAVPLPRGMREGWGLTSDGAGTFYASDGSSTLHELDAASLKVKRTVRVTVDGNELTYINDLQWVDGLVWANVWRDDRIAAIDPQSGEVRGFVDLSRLLTPEERNRLNSEEVLNGIAHDPNGDCMYVTGKNWPKLFKIAVPRLPAHSAEDPAQD